MKSFKHYTVSCITQDISVGSAVGNVQIYGYKAISEYGRANNISFNVKTYIATVASLAPMGHTLSPCKIEEIISDAHFQKSDIILIPHCGHSTIIDALSFAPSKARKAVLFFGITRPHIYPELQEWLEDGYRQAIVLNEADIVFVTSDYIAEDVRTFGVPENKICKIPLCADMDFPEIVPLRDSARNTVELTFLSRFCSAKGVVHLFDALQQWPDKNWRLNVIYHQEHSDAEMLDKYMKMSKKLWKGKVRWHASADEEAKRVMLEDTDILLSPSLHEGFAVPLIEALHYGCALVYSDAGSQPEISGGLGLQFPARDVPAFVDCLDKAAKARRRGMYACSVPAGELSAEKWREHAQAHVVFYSYENFKQSLCSVLFSGLPERYGNLHELLAERRVAVLNSLGLHTKPMPPIPQFLLNAVNEALAPHLESNFGPGPVQGFTPAVQVCSPAATSCETQYAISNAQLTQKAMQQARDAESTVQAIYQSFSWKVTAPMRALVIFADALKVAVGRKDIVRERECAEWQAMVNAAETTHDWVSIAQSRRSAVADLHRSLSWKITGPLRACYTKASKSNFLRRMYAIVLGKPYIPYGQK